MYEYSINGKNLKVETGVSLFSPNGVDKGTLSMLRHVEFSPEDKLLDLGCGCGIVSLIAASSGVNPVNITLTDIDSEAVNISKKNLIANGFEGFEAVVGDALSQVKDSGYTLILSNPPYHTDFSVAKSFIEKGFNRLKVDGKLYMVTKRKDWYKNKIVSVFGGVRIFEEDGYFIFEAQKRSTEYASSSKKKKEGGRNR